MPLPKPNGTESRNEFISRCIIDSNVRNDFGTLEQRLAVCGSLYEQEKMDKMVKQSFENDFEEALTRAEYKSITDFTRYYLSEYEKAIKVYLNGGINQSNIIQFFKLDELKLMYGGLYTDVGLKMAKWSESKYKKLYNKAEPVYYNQWAEQFATLGYQQAGLKIVGVQGTARNTIVSVIQKLTTDETFQTGGSAVQTRMLRNQFQRYSKYQAERVVRTESNYAANFANITTAQTIFPENQLKKQWISGADARVRPSHQIANGQIVLASEKFTVGDSKMAMPSDPAGGASEVINCRCSMIMIPIENAQTVGEISDISFGLAQQLATNEATTGVQDMIVNNTLTQEIVEETINISQAKTIKEAEQWAIENGIAESVNYVGISLENANKINNISKKVINDFNLEPLKVYKGGTKALGRANGITLKYNKSKMDDIEINKIFFNNVSNYQKKTLYKIDYYKQNSNFFPDSMVKDAEYSSNFKRYLVHLRKEDVVEDLFIHELGHTIEDQLLGQINRSLIQSRFRTIENKIVKFNPETEKLRNEFRDIYLNLSNEEKFKISRYSTTDIHETFAESLVMYYREPENMPINIKNFFDKLKEYARN